MGLYDRDYMRRIDASSVGRISVGSVTTWLIAINIAAFVADLLLVRGQLAYELVIEGKGIWRLPPVAGLCHFSIAQAIASLEIWRFVTFQFIHANLTHLLMNMFSLYFFGPLIEGCLGARRYLTFYLVCGIAGPVAYVLLWSGGFFGAGRELPSTYIPLVGASAGVFGVLIAAARLVPDATVMIYGWIPARLRTVAWLLLGLAVYTVFFGGRNAGGEAAHLGGAAMGYLLIRNPHWLRLPRLWQRRVPF